MTCTMEAELARLETALANAENRAFRMERDVEALRQMFIGKIPQIIRVPSGVAGFNMTYEVMVKPMGAEEADAAEVEEAGAFVTLFAKDGHTYLQGGSVTGGNGGGHTFDDYKVIDSADESPLANSGKVLYIKVKVKATVSAGIMLPGCEVVAGSGWGTATIAAGVPPNESLTVTSDEGHLYREIGRWNDTAFLPSGPAGNRQASGCIGNFQITP